MLLLILFAFIAGVITILSPCILPILPIVLSGSLTGGNRRPYGIVTGFILSFTFFTLFLSSLVKLTGISADALRTFSVVIIIALGLSLALPQIQALMERFFNFFTRFAPTEQKDGFFGGVVVGLSLGLIWTPCVGPILAAVISLALTGSVSSTAVFITLAYALGTAIPMLAIIQGGRQLLNKVPWLLQNTANIQRVFGLVMVVVGIAIALNFDRQFQTWILEKFPQYGTGLTKIEDNSGVSKQLDTLSGSTSSTSPSSILMAEDKSPLAPDFTGGTAWLNSTPLSLQKELKGKVVLVDFWTYSCINCIRTLPYITDWYAKYKDKDFVIIGVHSPEFEFEKNGDNVKKALTDFGITYPVVQDNEFKIWNAYNNRFWPAHYLIDKNGKIRYTHAGEGKYAETENAIRTLLDEAPLSTSDVSAATEQPPMMPGQTSETYLGYSRAEGYNQSIKNDTTFTYTQPTSLENDETGLAGSWKVEDEKITAQADQAKIYLNFSAKNVYLVLNTATGQPKKVNVLLDGKPLSKEFWTKDMDQNGVIIVDEARKYDIVNLNNAGSRHLLELDADAGVEAYAFTFGG